MKIQTSSRNAGGREASIARKVAAAPATALGIGRAARGSTRTAAQTTAVTGVRITTETIVQDKWMILIDKTVMTPRATK